MNKLEIHYVSLIISITTVLVLLGWSIIQDIKDKNHRK